jgi:PAS domain S-box-containing protein
MDANQAACNLFDYTRAELKGKAVNSLFDSRDLSDKLNSSESFRGRIIGMTSDCSRLYCDVHYTRSKTESGGQFGTLQIIDSKDDVNESENLKLFEAVVKGASDAVVILKSRSAGKRRAADIVFVNEAYTDLTGYSFDELIGQQAKFLNAPKSSLKDLVRLRHAIELNEYIDLEILTYKKNGDEFWAKVSVSPVFNGDICTHFIAIAKDITKRKNREQLKFLQSDISRIFNNHKTLSASIDHSLNLLMELGHFSNAELWLTDDENRTIGLAGYKSKGRLAQKFYDSSSNVQVFKKGEALPGETWETGELQFWRNLDKRNDYVRYKEVHAIGLRTVYGVPVYYDENVIGALLLGVMEDHQKKRYYTPILEQFGKDFGSEIDRKQTEEQLNRVFSFSPDIICVAGMDGYFKQLNPAMSRMLGYSHDELLSHPISSFTHPDDRLKTENEIDALNKNEGAKTFQNRFITKSGKVVWLSWTTRTFYNEGKIYSIARDVTEQKELEILLRQANKMSKIGGWEYDVVEQTSFWSDITRQIHEMEPDYEADLEDGIRFYKEGKSRDTIRACISDAINIGKSFDVELQIVTGKENERWIRVIGDAEIVQGQVKKIYGSFQDIHQRKTAELMQRELSLERERILESIGDAFFALDRGWIVTYWNSSAEEMLSLPREEIVGKNLWDVFQDATDLEFYKQYHIAMEKNETVSFEDFYPGVEKWFDVSAYPSNDGLSVFFKDITRRKKTEEQLLELNRELKEQTKELAASNAELEQFAFVASHDLQEPLRMVTSFLNQLEKKYGDKLDEKAKRYIWFATDGAKRMRQIILDLLNYSRIGRVDTNPEPVDLNQVMEAVIRDFRKTIEAKDAVIQWNDLPQIMADNSSIHSLMSNLIGNALKYQPENNQPKITVSSEKTEKYYKISVSDNGIGISPEYREKIFQIFQRLHSSDEYSGTGIGLAICRKIVETHDGTISVESKEGIGSTFTFEIPKSFGEKV